MSERLLVQRTDITALEIEAVLRSVGSDLEPIAPIGRQIELKAGPDVVERLGRLGELPPGAAVVTPAGGLGATFLIHAVVRSRDEPVTQATLRKALLNGLRRAADLGIERLAIPPLGTGAGNLEVDVSASTMVSTLREHFAASSHPSEVVITVANDYEHEVFQREAERSAPSGGEAP